MNESLTLEIEPELVRQTFSRLVITCQNGDDFDVVAVDRFRFDSLEAVATVLVIEVGIGPQRERSNQHSHQKPRRVKLDRHDEIRGDVNQSAVTSSEFGGSITQSSR